MMYAIVEQGGKQYKVVEGETLEVDRLPVNAGDNIKLERVLMVVDGDDISVGTPTVNGIQVKTTVVGHFKGPKIIVFKYRPRKRIRVKRGHRQQYTRLMVDVIGNASKVAEAKKVESQPVKKVEAKAEKKEAAASTPPKGTKTAVKKTVKAPAKKAPAKKTEKAAAKKAPAKSSPKGKATSAKKATTTASPKGKTTSSTNKTEK